MKNDCKLQVLSYNAKQLNAAELQRQDNISIKCLTKVDLCAAEILRMQIRWFVSGSI